MAGQSFTLETTVHNKRAGDIIPSIAVPLYFYRSTDGTIDETDAFLELIRITNLKIAATQTVSLEWTAPRIRAFTTMAPALIQSPERPIRITICSVGAYVRVVAFGEDPFNIELVFLDDFTRAQTDLFQQAARRWETIITDGLQDVDFSPNPHKLDEMVVVDDIVDDLRIFVEASIDDSGIGGRKGGT